MLINITLCLFLRYRFQPCRLNVIKHWILQEKVKISTTLWSIRKIGKMQINVDSTVIYFYLSVSRHNSVSILTLVLKLVPLKSIGYFKKKVKILTTLWSIRTIGKMQVEMDGFAMRSNFSSLWGHNYFLHSPHWPKFLLVTLWPSIWSSVL